MDSLTRLLSSPGKWDCPLEAGTAAMKNMQALMARELPMEPLERAFDFQSLISSPSFSE